MDRTIILSELSKSIAALTQCTEADAETFVRELFMLAAEHLEAEGEAVVPGLGRFAVTGGTVVFAPDSELAEAVNAPFAAFEAVELPDGFDTEEAEAPEEEPKPEPETEEPQPEAEEVAKEPLTEEEEEAEEVAAAADFEEEEDSDADPEPEDDAEEEEEETPTESVRRPGREKSLAWVIWLAACVVCFAGGFYAGYFIAPGSNASPTPLIAEAEEVEAVGEEEETQPEAEAATEPAEAAEAEEVVEPEPAPAPKPKPVVTDTVSAGRFLTTMARAHYGQMEYWVYIYRANADRLPHPDRLEAGTVVVIPSAEELGLIPGDAAKIREANALAKEIYAGFN